MFYFLPKKKDKRWFKIFGLVYGMILLITFSLIFAFYDITFQNIEGNQIFSILILTLIPSGIISVTGYFGAKLIPVITSIGVLIGFGYMSHFFNEGYKLSGLVGSIVFFYSIAISTGVGIVLEIIYYFIRTKSNYID